MSGWRDVPMREKRSDKNTSENTRHVLRGYRREGKRFVPPFLQYINTSESRWIDDRVPELIWIALLIHMYGVKEGTMVATNIAEAAAGSHHADAKAYAATSDYAKLSNVQKHQIRLALTDEGILAKASRGLAALIEHYNDFPLAFLADTANAKDDIPSSTLDDLQAVIQSISDRQSVAGTFAQAGVVYIFFINGKLQVAPSSSLARFPAVENYPMTDESLRVAASIRSAAALLLTQGVSKEWGIAFWNQGLTLSPCEVA